MLADYRIRRVRETEFLQPGPTRFARQIIECRLSEEPVKDNLRKRGTIERRGDRLGE